MTGILLIALAVIAAERMPGLRFRRVPVLRAELGTDLLWLLSYGAVALAISAVSAGWLREAAEGWRAHLPLAVQAVCALVVIDLGNYGVHWLLHRVDALWAVHQVHHSSRHLDWLVTFRSHVVEQALRRVAPPVALVIAGVPAPAVGIATIIFVGWAMLNHSNLRLPLGPLERVFITPRLHRLHHMPGTAERNLGTVFVWWDRLRGTLVYGDPPPTAAFGLPRGRDAYPERWRDQLVAPFAGREAGGARLATDGR